MHETTPALRKAAILIAALDPQTADRLLAQMSADQAALVRRAVADLAEIEPEEQSDVIDEFFRIGPISAPTLGIDDAHARPAPHSPRPSAARDDDEVTWEGSDRDSAAGPFDFLQETHTQRITPLLQDEHPQTIAVVISHLAPDRAAEVLDTLQSELQVDVIRRLVDLDQAHPEVVRDIERGLKSRIVAHVRDERRRCAGMKAVSGILAAARPRTKRAILSNLALHDGRLAGRLVRRKFDFEDLGRLELDALAAVVAAVPNEVLLLALATAAPELTNRLLRTLPTTEARAMRRSLDTLGPTRLSDVEQAQAELARVAQQLEREGRIEILVGQELV